MCVNTFSSINNLDKKMNTICKKGETLNKGYQAYGV